MNAIDFLLPAELIVWMVRVAIAGVSVCGLTWLVDRLIRGKSRTLSHAVLICSLVILFVVPLLDAVAHGGIVPLLKLQLSSVQPAVTRQPTGDQPPAETGNVPANHQSSPVERMSSSEEAATGPASIPVSVSTRPPETTSDPAAPHPDRHEPLFSDSETRSSAVEQLRAEPAEPAPLAWQFIGTWVAAVWLSGICLFCLRIVIGFIRVRRLWTRCQTIDKAELQTLALDAAHQTGLKRPPALLCSEQTPLPIAVGIRQPAIVLPAKWQQDFSPDELKAILLHESAHIVRRDQWAGLLQRVVAAIYWWNPLVHLLNRNLNDVREEICDNFVIRAQGNGHTMAGLLLKVAERVTWMQNLPATAGLAEPRHAGGLQERILHLVDPHRDLSTKLSRKSIPWLVLFSVVTGSAAVLFDVGTEDVRAQSPESAVPESAPAETTESPEETVEILGYEQIDEVLEILNMLEEKTRANADRLKTWSGMGEVVRESHGHHLNPGPVEDIPPLRRRASFEFAIDFEQDALYSAWKDLIPISEVDPETNTEIPFAENLFGVQSIVTPEHWLRSATSEPVEGTDDLLPQDQRRREITRKRNETERLYIDGVVDLRLAFTYGGRFVGNPQPAWERLAFLQRWPEFVDKAETKSKQERLKRYLQIRRQDIGDHQLITVTTHYFSSDSPDAQPDLAISVTFDERVGYQVVKVDRELDGLHSQSDVKYVNHEGVFLPSRFSWSKLEKTSWEGDVRVGRTSEVVTLHEFKLNEPLEPSTFTYGQFDLNEGERVVDEIDKQALIQRGGKLIPTTTESDKDLLLSSLPVGLYRNSTVGARWNSLLRQHIELSNHRMRVERGEVKVEDYAQFLVDQNAQEQAVARAFVRLARKAGPWERVTFRALEQVVTSEYSGPVAEQAAELLLKDHLEHRGFPALCGKLGFSTPPSLSAETVLRGAIENSNDETVRAQACLSLGRFLRIKAQKLRMLNALPSRRANLIARYGHDYVSSLSEVPAEALEHEAELLLNRVLEEFQHIETGTFTDRLLSDDARLELVRLDNHISRTAREIVGTDVTGRTMRLSDYGGKVRVLYFWGHWCPPCRKSYALHRELVEKYRDRPFAFLGINSDAKAATLQKLIADGDVTWECWRDGATKPWPIHGEWGLYGSPWYFVLDKQGRIRFYDVRGDELKEAIELLMEESATPTP